MSHSSESRLISALDKLADASSDDSEDDELQPSSDSESHIGSGGLRGDRNGDDVRVTPQAAEKDIQVVSPPPTVPQKRKHGPKAKGACWILFLRYSY